MIVSLASVEMTPAVADAMLRSGNPRLARSNMLKMSHRSVALTRDVMLIRRCRLRSNVTQPGPRATLRGALPNSADVTRVNAARLNHCSTV